MLKETRRLESDQSKHKSITKFGINAVTAQENEVSDRAREKVPEDGNQIAK